MSTPASEDEELALGFALAAMVQGDGEAGRRTLREAVDGPLADRLAPRLDAAWDMVRGRGSSASDPWRGLLGPLREGSWPVPSHRLRPGWRPTGALRALVGQAMTEDPS